jgi:hypothetical protein
MGYEKEVMTGHGFRAMARTILDEELGMRPDIIEKQLAHTVRDPLGRAYNRTSHLPARREMMQMWADYLDDLRKLPPALPAGDRWRQPVAAIPQNLSPVLANSGTALNPMVSPSI